jgi:hypothetical protein
MRGRWLCVLLIACGGSAGHVDAPTPIDGPAGPSPDASLAALTCSELSAAAAARLPALDKKCQGVSDCVIVGGPLRNGCGGAPSLLSMGGAALSTAGAADPELVAIAAEFQRRCAQAPCSSANPCEADVAPPVLFCDGDTCHAEPQSCPNRADAPVCTAAAISCGDTTCQPDEYCTLDFPGACPLGQPDAACPGWCTPCGLAGCACPIATCHPLPAGCHDCDCVPAWADCPPATCSCGTSGGIVQGCPRP